MDLEALAEITKLKHRYTRALDTKDWELFRETLLPDATATYGEHLRFEDRDALCSFMEITLGPHVLTEHLCGQPEIDITGDSAAGTWVLADTVIIPEDGMLLRGAAFYHDRYARDESGEWRIAHTGYERTYELVISLADMPSLQLTSNRWAMAITPQAEAESPS
ncbi:nuclear transport factor 2 family protein [Rhodococcus sp. NPDC058505]|uniref:nuclear transport factor 2 family protein n=1 Tax=unclassified Rhodococcus (in: high G+C Gram-positive bacteria) TaxID=192944 RepID=UPI00364E5E23